MAVIGLHHAALAAANREIYERTVAFYRDVLGFPVVRVFSRVPRHITMLDMGNTILEIVMGAETENCGPVFHLALEVDSPGEVDAMLRKCVDAGCAPFAEPSELHGRDETKSGDDAVFGLRNAFCIGPAGERLEFYCGLHS